MKKLAALFALFTLVTGCATAPAPAPVKNEATPAPKLDAAAFNQVPKLSREQVQQKESSCDKGSVKDCADLVRFNGRNALGEAFAKDTHKLCVLEQVECQLNQQPFPRKKSRGKAHSAELIATWGTRYQDEDGPKSFEYKIYQ
jgi:hypothetical protein